MTRHIACVLIILLLAGAVCTAQEQPYMLRLADDVAAWRARLTQMDASANRAAADVIAGGNLYAFGPQPGFALEASARAGGLMLLKRYQQDTDLTARDTVLAAITSESDDAALLPLLDKAAQAGAQVVLFGGEPRAGATVLSLKEAHDAGSGLRVESMRNVAGMWAWTGRFIAACVERGKMPCVYQSYMLPGGRERGDFLQQHDSGRFHRVTDVQPHDADGIAAEFLTTIERSLRAAWSANQQAFAEAGALLRTTRADGGHVAVYALGHLYPGEFDQPQQPSWAVPTEADDPADAAAAIVLDYQVTPWTLLNALTATDKPVIWTCAQPAPAELDGRDHWVYLDPHWPLTDGVVALRGYDVMLLPSSGIMDTAVYWQLVELAIAP